MTRFMADSVTSRDIPVGKFALVAGYVNGRYRWSAADWARHPHSRHVGIAVSADFNGGQVLDCETGDATPAQCPGWARMRRKAGQIPTIYVNASTYPQVVAQFRVQHEDPPLYWIARWTGKAHLEPGSVATQYDHPPHSGGHYDLSLVADHWPGVDPAPVPPKPVPPPAPGPPGPTPTPPPPPPAPLPAPPPPDPSTPGAAHRSFWEFVAYVLGHGVPRLLQDLAAEIKRLKDS